LEKGYTHYVPSLGVPEAREAYAKYVSKTRNVEVDPGQIIVTAGAKPLIFYTMMALVNQVTKLFTLILAILFIPQQ